MDDVDCPNQQIFNYCTIYKYLIIIEVYWLEYLENHIIFQNNYFEN